MPVTGSRFCDDCKVDINRKGWSKHEKTDKHKLNMKSPVGENPLTKHFIKHFINRETNGSESGIPRGSAHSK